MKEIMQKEIGTLIDICHTNLKNSEVCQRYLHNRGLSEESISKYKIGFFPQNVGRIFNFVPRATLEKLGIIEYSGDSKFSEYFYLTFPILSEYQEPVGIAGRTLLNDDQRGVLEIPKYENSIFKKSHTLYGLNHSRGHILRMQNAYVVEGYFDHISMDDNGIKNSVAICGTAFSKNHLLRLARYTDKLTFVLDNDDGGRRSMERINSKFLNKGVKLRFKLLPEGIKDIDQYFSEGGTKQSFDKDLKTFTPNW